MNENKTKKNNADVMKFIETIQDKEKKEDIKTICKLMEKISGESPKMWGSSIVGFGEYHYKGKSGREGDWMITGFSPRKAALTLYIMPGFDEYDGSNTSQELLQKLGKHKTGKSCLYIKKLEDINLQVLEQLIRNGYEWMVKKYH